MKTIDEFLDNEYRDYAEEVSFKRALPSLIDGMKPVRRKIFYYMKKNRSAGFIRVSSIAGGLAEKCNYHHGEASAQGTIISLSKDFPSSNNVPILLPKGAFGSKLLPSSAAQARYIQSAYNPEMDYIFLDDELMPPNSDLESPEPEHYLPIIPMMLVNGISGIGIGYAVKILPHKISDVISVVEACLHDKEIPLIDPWWKGCNYSVERVTESSFRISGKIDQRGDSVTISELIPGMDRNKIISKLLDLQDKEKIKSYSDESKEEFKIIVSGLKNIESLDLSKVFHENYTMLDENGAVKVFDSISEFVKHFVRYRLTFYDKRKEFRIKKLGEEIDRQLAIIMFMENIKKVSESSNKEEIFALFKGKIPGELISYCMEKPLRFFMKNNRTEYEQKIKEAKEKIEYYKNVSIVKLYQDDLDALKKRNL
jgi:DNA topoisomerase-2